MDFPIYLDTFSMRLSTVYLKRYLVDNEHSGSVVEYLTLDLGAAGSSLTGITVLCP